MALRFNPARAYSFKIILISLGVAAFVIFLSFFGILDRFELTTLDYRFKLRPSKKGVSQVAIVEIAEDSIAQVGRWPWSRDWHAELINVLAAHQAKVIDIDILFSESSNTLLDAMLATAIQSAGTVYLPFVFEDLKTKTIRVQPLKLFSEYIKGTGYINVLPDEDGVIRHVELIREHEGKRYYHIGFKVVCDQLGVREQDIVLHPKRNIELRNTKFGTIVIPVDENNLTVLNWPGKWSQSFRHYSFIDVIVSQQQQAQGVKPRIDLNEFKDSLALIGLTAIGLTDIKPIPLETLYPALGVHACIIDNVLRRDFIYDLGKLYRIIASVIFAFFMGVIYLLLRKPVRFAAATLVLTAGYSVAGMLLFNVKGLWINIIYPLASIALSYTAITLYSQILAAIDRARLFRLATTDGLTGLFVIGHFYLLLDARLAEAKRYGQKLSVIMADIDHFKQFNDTYGHLAGDMILKEVAKICKGICRDLDVVARYGGEEFVLMLPNTDIGGAKLLAERLRQAVEKNVFKNVNKEYSVSMSLGVAELAAEDTRSALIGKADAALYLAKNGGRNIVCDWLQCQEKKENS